MKTYIIKIDIREGLFVYGRPLKKTIMLSVIKK